MQLKMQWNTENVVMITIKQLQINQISASTHQLGITVKQQQKENCTCL